MIAMETSSPLAAMKPPTLAMPWPHGREEPAEFATGFLRPYRPREYRGFREFDFNKMSMNKPTSDYFSLRPVRGSSPTQSLAVDLSQNFHIDKSPQLPTPRRSLFTRDCLNLDRKQDVITPPIPSSSPGPELDIMEASPLPHKQPQSLVVTAVLCSPTPAATPAVEALSVMPELRRSESQPADSNLPTISERRTSNPVRPSIRKGYSHSGQVNTLRPRSSQSSQAPFWFGPRPSTINKPSLETFMESPPSQRKLAPSQSNPSLVDSPADLMAVMQDGSPVAITRRASSSRPRFGISRRTQSMQYNEPYRPVRAEKRCCTTGSIQAASVLVEEPQLRLPYFKLADEVDGLPRITMDTLIRVLNGDFKSELGETAIIDCRFEYEFNGGHIEGALNFNDKDEIADKLFEGSSVGNKTLIFHCEYSAHRAPLMAKFVRQRDRAVNQDKYPQLDYPDIYILDGGYRDFFRNHSNRCFPQNYVEMDAKEHEHACEKGMAKVKRRNKLSRAQTYAFGQSIPQISEPNVSVLTVEPPDFDEQTSTLEAMDVDFNSPIEIKMPSTFAPDITSPCFFSAIPQSGRFPPKRLSSY